MTARRTRGVEIDDGPGGRLSWRDSRAFGPSRRALRQVEAAYDSPLATLSAVRPQPDVLRLPSVRTSTSHCSAVDLYLGPLVATGAYDRTSVFGPVPADYSGDPLGRPAGLDVPFRR